MSEGVCIKVCVRIRPFNALEIEQGEDEVTRTLINAECSTVLQMIPPKDKDGKDSKQVTTSYNFDWVISGNAPQELVFRSVGERVVDGIKDGYHGCVFAYGQTSSGKSHSIFGGVDEMRGLLPRIVEGIFEKLTTGATKSLVKLSYLEIYNEKVRDLLRPAGDKPLNLEVRQHPKFGVFVENLLQNVVKDAADVQRLLDFGAKMRIVGATNMNAVSSRSHAVVSLNVEQSRTLENNRKVKSRGTLHAVDLAGSERLHMAGGTADRQQESKNINSSLSALAMMIATLAERETSKTKKIEHIPYRTSKLTYLLSESLMGNCRTVMLACGSPAASNYQMTMSTMRFAVSVKKIKTKPVKNEELEGAMIKNLQDEIAALRAQLAGANPDERKEINAQLETDKLIAAQLNTTWDEALRQTMETERDRHEALKGLGLSVNAIKKAAARGSAIQHSEDADPYLVNVCDDPLLAGCLMYTLPQGQDVTVGSDSGCTIVLDGVGIQPACCYLQNVDGFTVKVVLDTALPQHGRSTRVGRVSEAGSPSRGRSLAVSRRSNAVPETGKQTFDQKKNARKSVFKSGVSKVFVNTSRVVGQTTLDHQDKLRIGSSHVFQLFSPKAAHKRNRTTTETVSAGTVASDMWAHDDGAKILAVEFAQHMEKRIGRKAAARIFATLQELTTEVEAANELTEELRGDANTDLVFQAHVLTEVGEADKDPEIVVALYEVDLVDESVDNAPKRKTVAVWSTSFFKERLELMWELHRAISDREAPWGQEGDIDPWLGEHGMDVKLQTVEGVLVESERSCLQHQAVISQISGQLEQTSSERDHLINQVHELQRACQDHQDRATTLDGELRRQVIALEAAELEHKKVSQDHQNRAAAKHEELNGRTIELNTSRSENSELMKKLYSLESELRVTRTKLREKNATPVAPGRSVSPTKAPRAKSPPRRGDQYAEKVRLPLHSPRNTWKPGSSWKPAGNGNMQSEGPVGTNCRN